jgi:hypothetical protein
MSRVILGNHSSVIVPRQDRDSIRKFYCDVLGGKITKAEDERDFLRLGDDFYIGFLYGDVPDESQFLRTARSVWLEIKSDNVEEMTRKILDSGIVRKLEVPDPHLETPHGSVTVSAGELVLGQQVPYNQSSLGCARSGRPLSLCIQASPSNGSARSGGPKMPRSAIAL